MVVLFSKNGVSVSNSINRVMYLPKWFQKYTSSFCKWYVSLSTHTVSFWNYTSSRSNLPLQLAKHTSSFSIHTVAFSTRVVDEVTRLVEYGTILVEKEGV